jgi:hypothetical protein
MKKIYLISIIGILCLPVYGQRKTDIGVLGGVTSYMGDINPSKLFYSPLPAGGIFFRYNLHPRQSIRTSLILGGLRASDLDFKNDFQQARAASFSGEIGEWAVQFEFNFLPYSTLGKRWNYTPYFAAGAAISFINTTVFTYQPAIPLSVGFKINIYKNMGLEAEYGFRKTFYDNFDGQKDFIASADNSWLHNNDWYSFAGLALTWKMFSSNIGCPAYGDAPKSGKH